MATPRIYPAGSARELNVVGEKIWIRVSGAETGGAYCLLEEASPPQGGVPLHLHRREDESFYVLDGVYEFRLGEQRLKGGPGTFLFAPRGIAHSFQNVAPRTGRLLVVVSPPALERFFIEADELGRAQPPPMEELAWLATKYELEFLPG